MLQDHFAVITGAASVRGNGSPTAQIFAKYGARVAIPDLDKTAATQAAKSSGAGHIGIACDVTKQETCMNAARIQSHGIHAGC